MDVNVNHWCHCNRLNFKEGTYLTGIHGQIFLFAQMLICSDTASVSVTFSIPDQRKNYWASISRLKEPLGVNELNHYSWTKSKKVDLFWGILAWQSIQETVKSSIENCWNVEIKPEGAGNTWQSREHVYRGKMSYEGRLTWIINSALPIPQMLLVQQNVPASYAFIPSILVFLTLSL